MSFTLTRVSLLVNKNKRGSSPSTQGSATGRDALICRPDKLSKEQDDVPRFLQRPDENCPLDGNCENCYSIPSMIKDSVVHQYQPKNRNRPSANPVNQRIVAEARRHFLAHGFRSVTMDDLAEELGMSKKTLYAYFPSKTALLKAVVLDKFRSVESDLARITSECSSDFLAALQNLLTCIQQHTEEIRQPFVRDVRREAPEMFRLVESRRRDLIHRYFGELFNKGRRAGIIRKDIPSKLMIEVLLGAVQAIMNPQKMSELGVTPKAGFSAILTVILDGVITEKGRSKL